MTNRRIIAVTKTNNPYMVTIFIRTALIYLILVVSMRLMGKRQVGELQLSELTVTILLSEIAASPLTDKNIPFAHAVCAILLLLSIEVILSYILLHHPAVKTVLTGKPSMIIRRGVLDQKELERQRLCLSELLCALRQKGIADISDVEYAIMEENGQLSVFPKAEASPLTPKACGQKAPENGISHALIIDRVIIQKNLDTVGWSREKLERELERRGAKLCDVFMFAVGDSGKITLILKGESGAKSGTEEEKS